MIEIIPSILVSTEEMFEKNILELQNASNLVHIDVADGIFVKTTTWADPEKIQKMVENEIELHLMVQNPIPEIEKWTNVHQVKRIYFHFEANEENIDNTIESIRELGAEVGIALKPETPIDVLTSFINEIDAVLFLSVDPGKQGQPFQKETLEKIKAFHSKGWNHFVQIDGGVNEQTLPDIVKTPIDAVSVGSAIFAKGNAKENFQKIQTIIHD